MAVNKVDVNGATVLDLTQDSVTPETLKKGETTHDASGVLIVGTMETVMIPKTTALLRGDGVGGVAAATTDATPTQGSTNPVQSGGVYTALANMGSAKIQMGSYTGTGTAGSGNKRSLTFNFEPKFLIIVNQDTDPSNTSNVWLWAGQPSKESWGSFSWTISGKTMTWWHSNSSYADRALNESGRNYYWVAIG